MVLLVLLPEALVSPVLAWKRVLDADWGHRSDRYR
jgi:hypothetical protein